MIRIVRATHLLMALTLSTAVGAEPVLPLAPSGAPASAFPAPSRPVAEIVSPIWANERSRDAIDEAGQLASRLGVGHERTSKAGLKAADAIMRGIMDLRKSCCDT